ncbi:hypothetical protein I79_000050 [Cricetulus griseus]|uniref:Uncharacterized protein n=1 Tax=Cricetulus griseus TaxID=10029 RepID=G3GRA7_CRIGR|nr:hypothetical protein I79_000050 [Cricetulus griseus]
MYEFTRDTHYTQAYKHDKTRMGGEKDWPLSCRALLTSYIDCSAGFQPTWVTGTPQASLLMWRA